MFHLPPLLKSKYGADCPHCPTGLANRMLSITVLMELQNCITVRFVMNRTGLDVLNEGLNRLHVFFHPVDRLDHRII